MELCTVGLLGLISRKARGRHFNQYRLVIMHHSVSHAGQMVFVMDNYM
jgi:hypothetical protein